MIIKVSLIAAVDLDNNIGLDNDLPWPRIKSDMTYFKVTTTGYPIVMGRKTFESFGSKPLPNRLNIIISSKEVLENNYIPNVKYCTTILEALTIAAEWG